MSNLVGDLHLGIFHYLVEEIRDSLSSFLFLELSLSLRVGLISYSESIFFFLNYCNRAKRALQSFPQPFTRPDSFANYLL